ncbi:histidine kinase [Alkalimonas collagenimarina]|uniref:Histidine kinase n=1 Tax=Alkalimonas collagenimarina TaxID=400390 RepID=A0ABT9GW84_9GAMM|nr:histidine kinase [Alkalimonas collagenimarina]MDP4535322.1 histidine kinase [Alkalimonas collagenimarina]
MIKLESKDQLFWLCQCSGWAAYALLTELLIKIPGPEPWSIHLGHLLLDTSCGFGITLLLRQLYSRARKQSVRLSIVLHLGCLLAASLLWTQFKWITLQWFYGSWWQPMTWFDFGTWTSASLTMLATWTAGYYGIKIYLDNVEQRHKAAEAMHLAKESQLKMLRYQLNPHFMFNSINAICTLILKQHNSQAVGMLEKLCDLLRYSLYTDPLAKITVQEEKAILQTYVDIEQCRFQSHVNVHIHSESACEHLLIPSLLLQPLVENALKHGMGSQSVIEISVAFRCLDEQLEIEICDNGTGFDGPCSEQGGIGMKNCQERLQLIYPERSEFRCGNQPEGGAWIRIRLPREPATEQAQASPPVSVREQA